MPRALDVSESNLAIFAWLRLLLIHLAVLGEVGDGYSVPGQRKHSEYLRVAVHF